MEWHEERAYLACLECFIELVATQLELAIKGVEIPLIFSLVELSC